MAYKTSYRNQFFTSKDDTLGYQFLENKNNHRVLAYVGNDGTLYINELENDDEHADVRQFVEELIEQAKSLNIHYHYAEGENHYIWEFTVGPRVEVDPDD